VKERLPNLPTTPAGLFDADPEHALEREQGGGTNDATNINDIAELAHPILKPPVPEVIEKSTIHDVKGKARSFNSGAWVFIQSTLIVLFCLVVVAGLITMYSYHGVLRKWPEKNSIEKLNPAPTVTPPAPAPRTKRK
jgi:hypothetical protein